jgi:hypothetical protein
MQQSTLLPQSGTTNVGEGRKTIRYLLYEPDIAPGGLISVSEIEVQAGWRLVVPGEHQDEPGWGCLNRCERRVCRCHSMVDRLQRKVRMNQQGLGLKKSRKMKF